jgi:hypothetical protein
MGQGRIQQEAKVRNLASEGDEPIKLQSLAEGEAYFSGTSESPSGESLNRSQFTSHH